MKSNSFPKGDFILKIAVSDFDGTLFFHQNDTIPQINIEAVKKWRSVGNIFCICTGRDMRSLMYEMNRHRMEYDFIICNNGGTLFDKNLNIVKSFPLDRQMLLKLVHSDIAADSWHIMYSAVDKMRTTINSDKSQLLKYFNSVKYKNQEIIKIVSIEEALAEMEPVQISLAYENEQIAEKYAQRIETEFNDAFSANLNLNCIDVCRKNITKASGVKELLKLNPAWQNAEVLTIGDAQNDVPMIEEFNGYSLNSATEHAKQHAARLYNSVGEMLLKNL